MLKKLSLFLLTAASVFALKTGVYAENIKQTEAETHEITVKWTYSNVTSLQISEKASEDSFDDEKTVRDGKKEYSVSGLKAGRSYFLRVKAGGVWQEVIEVSTCPDYHDMADVEQTDAGKNSATVSWGAAPGATGYEVYLGADNSDRRLKKVLTTNAKKAVLNISKAAYVKVVPFRKLDNGYIAMDKDKDGQHEDDIKPLPGKVTKIKQDKTSKSIKITWEEMEEADGYQLLCTDYKGKGKVRKNFLSFETKCFLDDKRPTFLKVKMRAYVNVRNGKKFGAWTKEKVVVPDVLAHGFSTTSYTSGSLPKVKIYWGKIKGAKKYEVYMSTSYDGPYKKIKTTKKRNLYISSFRGHKLAWIQAYYFKIVAVGKIDKKVYRTKKNLVKSWSRNKIDRD